MANASDQPYELLEGGFIDRAIQYLGFGTGWVIGPPKSVTSKGEPIKFRSASPNGRKPQSTISASPQSAILDVPIQPIESVFGRLLPDTFRIAHGPDDNAIEYRNVMIMGSQGSGKTTLAQVLALALGRNTAMRIRFSLCK